MTVLKNTVLKIENLVVHRGRQVVLQDVSLRLDGPGFYGLIGPNGGGKSTLLSVICGLLAASSGQVEVLGTTPPRAAPRIGYVPQAASFDRSFPVTLRGMLGTALIGPGLFARPDAQKTARIDAALAQTGILELANRSLSALSGGQLQRGLIARALATDPEFLLLDEPTASVDQSYADRLFELLCDLSQKIPVLVVSHGLSHIAAHCERVFCVNHILWEAKNYATASDLAAEIFNDPVHCGRHEVEA